LWPENFAMFAIFEKLFRHRVAALAANIAANIGAQPKTDLYSIDAPVWQLESRHGIYRGISGAAVAVVKNRSQAETLCDILNLANGGKPSRKLLDAIYFEDAHQLASK
jgi:hypothetical protein